MYHDMVLFSEGFVAEDTMIGFNTQVNICMIQKSPIGWKSFWTVGAQEVTLRHIKFSQLLTTRRINIEKRGSPVWLFTNLLNTYPFSTTINVSWRIDIYLIFIKSIFLYRSYFSQKTKGSILIFAGVWFTSLQTFIAQTQKSTHKFVYTPVNLCRALIRSLVSE